MPTQIDPTAADITLLLRCIQQRPGRSIADLLVEAAIEIERLRAALDKIAGICLGRDTHDLAAGKVYGIACRALVGRTDNEHADAG